MMNHKRYNRKGSALAYGLIIMAVVSIILVSLLQYITSQIRFGFERGDSEEAFQIAEAGIYWYRWYLAHEVSGKTVQQIQDFWKNGNPYGVNSPYEAEFSDPEGGPIGKYRIEVRPPDSNSTIVIVKSTGWTYKDPNATKVVQARFRRPSWSEYAVLANDVMRFGPGTQIYGKVQSNYGIRFDGVAHNIISSSVDQYDDPDHSGGNEFGVHTHVNPPPQTGVNDTYRSAEAPPNTPQQRTDVFQAGRQFPVPTVDFNGVISDLNYMKTASQTSGQGIYFNDDGSGRRIILKTDGTFDMCTVNSFNSGSYTIASYVGKRSNGNACTVSSCTGSGTCVSLQNYPIPNNGVIFVENNVWVEGAINNDKVAIVAANLIGGPKADMFVGYNNLTYTNFDGKDIIGLIAQRNISVIQDSQNFLTIDAALLAQSGRVGQNWYGSNYHKDTITVNGSIATNLRYGFAYTDGSGYTNRILNFDNNLLYYPPPYFPTGTEYSIDLWDEL